MRDFAQGHQPRGVGNDDVVAVLAQPRINFLGMGLADRRAKNSQLFAGEKGQPTADPIGRIERAHHAVARTNSDFVEGGGFVAGGEVQFVVTEVGPLRPSSRARGLENGLRLPAEKFLGGQGQQVLRGGEDLVQVFRPADSRGVDSASAELAGEKLLMTSGVLHNFSKPVGLNACDEAPWEGYPPVSERRRRPPYQGSFDKFARFP